MEGGRGRELFIAFWHRLQNKRLFLYLKYVVLVVLVQKIGAMVVSQWYLMWVMLFCCLKLLLQNFVRFSITMVFVMFGSIWKSVWRPTLWKIVQNNDHKSVSWQFPQWKYGAHFYKHTQEWEWCCALLCHLLIFNMPSLSDNYFCQFCFCICIFGTHPCLCFSNLTAWGSGDCYVTSFPLNQKEVFCT